MTSSFPNALITAAKVLLVVADLKKEFFFTATLYKSVTFFPIPVSAAAVSKDTETGTFGLSAMSME